MAPCRVSTSGRNGSRRPSRRAPRRLPPPSHPRSAASSPCSAPAGNRAAAAALLQRDGTKTPVKPAKDDAQPRMGKEADPTVWAKQVAAIFRDDGYSGIIVTVATKTSYVFDSDGESLREIPVRLADSARGSSVWKLDVAHATWRDAASVLQAGSDSTPPLTEAGVRTLCEAMGFDYEVAVGPGGWESLSPNSGVRMSSAAGCRARRTTAPPCCSIRRFPARSQARRCGCAP